MITDAVLPQRVEVADYHDFYALQAALRLLDKNIKVIEIGFNGSYLGIIYSGKQCDKYLELKKQILKESKEFYGIQAQRV